MFKFFVAILCVVYVPVVLAQAEQSPFQTMMAMAKIKKVITVETVAGNTSLLVTSIADAPAIVYLFAPGGPGTLIVRTAADGTPVTKQRSPIFPLAPAFLEKNVAWAAFGVPENFGTEISRERRQEPQHVEAVTQIARRMREEFPKARHILVGHSNGGITAALQSALDKPPVDGIIFSAPNISAFPMRWEPAHAKVPIKFIVHANDNCGAGQRGRMGINSTTINMAGRRFPLTVIKTPSVGEYSQCFTAPAPHFFTNNYAEYADAILKWTTSLR